MKDKLPLRVEIRGNFQLKHRLKRRKTKQNKQDPTILSAF